MDPHFEPAPPKAQTHGSTSRTDSGNALETQKSQDLIVAHANTCLAHQDQVQIPQDSEAQACFADSGASHHITSNEFKLQSKMSNDGLSKVIVGNGHNMILQSIGQLSVGSN